MDRTGLEYGSRRTSSRTRVPPERYGERANWPEYLELGSSGSISRNNFNSNPQNYLARVNTLPQPNSSLQSTMVNRSGLNINVPTALPQANSLRNMPIYPASLVNHSYVRKNNNFPMVSLNSYEITDVLLPLIPYCKGSRNDRTILRQALIPFNSSEFKIFIRFCKYDTKKTEQLDCLPKCFVLSINGESVQIKTKYSANPYEISRLLHDKKKDIFLRLEIPDPSEQLSPFHYGIVVVKKVDLRYLITSLPQTPSDCMSTINSVKKLLQHDDDLLLEGGEENNKLTVSLRCPFSSARLVNPARSKHCKHVACFDLQAFIEMNEASSKWRCPHCREYIVVADLIVDGLLVRILKDAPKDAKEAYIDIMGRYTYDVKREPVIPVIAAPIKRENISPETVPPPKKSKIEIECITIDDSDTEDESQSTLPTVSSHSHRSEPSNPTNSSQLSPNSQSSEDDTSSEEECEIIFAKLPPKPRIQPAPNSRSRSNNEVFQPHPTYPLSPNDSLSNLPCSSNSVAKPVPMHLNSNQQPKQQPISSCSILEQSVSSYDALNSQSQLSTRIVHNFFKDANGWQQKVNVRTMNSNMNSSSVPHYGIYENLPPESRPIFHPTYSNQPNIFQFPFNRQVYPYNNSAFRNPRLEISSFNENNINYDYDQLQMNSQTRDNTNGTYPTDPQSQVSDTSNNFLLPRMDPNLNS